MGKLYCNHRASQKLNTDQIRKETPFPKPSVQDCQGGSHENRCTIQPCCRVYGTELVQRNCKLVNTGGRCLRALKKVENLEMRLPLWQGDHSWALEPKGRIFFGPRPNQCPGHIITQSSQNTKWQYKGRVTRLHFNWSVPCPLYCVGTGSFEICWVLGSKPPTSSNRQAPDEEPLKSLANFTQGTASRRPFVFPWAAVSGCHDRKQITHCNVASCGHGVELFLLYDFICTYTHK